MKSKKNRVNRLFGIAVGALVIYLAISSMVLYVDITSYQNRLDDLTRQCEEQEIENQQLGARIEEGADYDYVIRTAREKLGLIFPEEQVFYNASGNQ
ncbi:MAG TPA: septum formation initiator family protein [Candidatus Faecivivens stercorigallinarum]|nr:septum formation initiator family protein [Candidatus Faecivivens stercorigallinarum]